MVNPRFSPDGRLLLTGGSDGMARLWDIDLGQPVGAMLRHGGQLECATFSPDGRRIATGGTNGVARLWDAASGQPIGLPLHHGGVVCRWLFSPDGKAGPDREPRGYGAALGRCHRPSRSGRCCATATRSSKPRSRPTAG